MAKQLFTTGQVLTAQEMTSLQQTAMLGGAASAKTASYTLVAADAGTAISMSNASATTITVNTALFASGDTVQITNLGAGVCTITAGTATVNTSASLALAQYESGTLYFTSTSAAIFIKGAGAAGGASGCTLIKRSSFTGVANTGTTFDDIFTLSHQSYMVIFESILPATGSDTLHMQFRYAGPTTQTTTYYAAALLIPAGTTLPNTNSGSTTTVIPISGGSNSSTVPNTGQLFINGVGNSSERCTWNGMMISPNSPQLVLCAGMNDTPETYTGLIFKSSASNITGTIAIYGWAV